jgi:hypothetical protein
MESDLNKLLELLENFNDECHDSGYLMWNSEEYFKIKNFIESMILKYKVEHK